MCCTFVLDQWILLTRYCTIASALAMTLSSSVMCYSFCKKPVLVFRFHFLNFNSHQCILHLQYFSRDIVFIPLVLFTVFFCIWDAHHCSGLRNDLYCVEWDVKLYTAPYRTIPFCIWGDVLSVYSHIDTRWNSAAHFAIHSDTTSASYQQYN